jgi:hypothetical protein
MAPAAMRGETYVSVPEGAGGSGVGTGCGNSGSESGRGIWGSGCRGSPGLAGPGYPGLGGSSGGTDIACPDRNGADRGAPQSRAASRVADGSGLMPRYSVPPVGVAHGPAGGKVIGAEIDEASAPPEALDVDELLAL